MMKFTQTVVETLVGAVVLLVSAFFLSTLLGHVDFGKDDGTLLSANFMNADGLTVGTDVRISGVKVGHVVEQRLDTATFEAIVDFTLSQDIKIPRDSSIKVLSDGLLGGNYLSLEPGGSEEFLKSGQRITYTSDAVNIIDLISKAIFSGNETKNSSGG